MTAPNVFISHSHEDDAWVRKFAEALAAQEVTVWLDEWQIAPGESIRERIEAGLRSSDAIVAVLPRSDPHRPNLFFELGVALGMGKRLIPIVPKQLENAALPFDIRSRKYIPMGEPEVAAREVADAVKGKAA